MYAKLFRNWFWVSWGAEFRAKKKFNFCKSSRIFRWKSTNQVVATQHVHIQIKLSRQSIDMISKYNLLLSKSKR